MKIILLFVLTFLVFLLIDLIWLGFIAKDFYGKQLAHLMAPKVKWSAAIVFYILYIIGILIFIVFPALEKQSFAHAAIYGAALGFLCYATYDLTNLATLKDWPIKLVIVDLIWGTVLTSLVSMGGFQIANWLKI